MAMFGGSLGVPQAASAASSTAPASRRPERMSEKAGNGWLSEQVVLQGRQLLAHGGQPVRVQRSQHQALALRQASQHLAPGVDDHAVAPGAPAIRVAPTLCGRDHVALVLDRAAAQRHMDAQLSGMSRITGIDFAKFDLDQPIPATATTNGHQSTLAKWIGKTPRSIAEAMTSKSSAIDYTGTPDHVAGLMAEVMQEVGGDGFLLFNGYFDRRYIMEVCDGLVPELQRRGLTRKAYAHKHFRDNLMEF